MKGCIKCCSISIQHILGRVRYLCARDASRSRHPSCHDERKSVSGGRCGPDGQFYISGQDDEC